MKATLARLWRVWRELTADVGDFQSKLLLTLVYFMCVGPFGLCAQLLSDPLNIRHTPTGTAWTKRIPQPDNLQTVRRQY